MEFSYIEFAWLTSAAHQMLPAAVARKENEQGLVFSTDGEGCMRCLQNFDTTVIRLRFSKESVEYCMFSK